MCIRDRPYVWVEDDDVSECTRCSTGFGMFNRKHHCRRCGKVFCDKCSKNRTKLPPEDGYGDEKVRVCQPCFEIVTGKRKALPVSSGTPGEADNYAQDRVELFGNSSTQHGGGGMLSGWGRSDADKDIASMDKEIAKLQVKSLNDAAHAIEVNADTLEHIVLRSEQTKEDLRKIENIHATHAAADLLIAKMERGNAALCQCCQPSRNLQPRVEGSKVQTSASQGVRPRL
eukprot:TRINITY_DN2523_c0_g1_i7.p1 TRINITY_DN2523_c0_g1~~TRINITY_DN2523_c0_g1_i7.p1  ORF type:complete len:229 (+),score=49.75 TRINITY_DN2523_c0_g1_i7:83-769(+)